jgi:hypothetical protein
MTAPYETHRAQFKAILLAWGCRKTMRNRPPTFWAGRICTASLLPRCRRRSTMSRSRWPAPIREAQTKKFRIEDLPKHDLGPWPEGTEPASRGHL